MKAPTGTEVPRTAAAFRVLHVVNRLGDRGDGIANMCVDLACQQAACGMRAMVATVDGGFTDLVRTCGVEVLDADFADRSVTGLWRAYRNLRRHVRAVDPEIVHAHTVVAAVVARLAAIGARAKVVATVHNEYQRGVVLMAAAHRVVGVSAAVSAAMRGHGVPARKIRTVLNGVVGSPRYRAAVEHRDALGPDDVRTPAVVAVGAVSHRKGADVLVAAAGELARTHGAHTYVVGNIDWTDPVEAAGRSGYSDHIHFVGFHPHPAQYLARATVFVLASRRDPAPLVVAEALAAGVPVVASAVDGVPEMLADGRAGLLVPPGDAAALAAAVGALLVDEDRRAALSGAARSRSRELGVDRVCADYRTVYAELVDVPRAGARRQRAVDPPVRRNGRGGGVV